MFYRSTLAAFITATLTAAVSGDGLYSKGSGVLQVDGKSYNKLIAKSNQVSVCSYIKDLNDFVKILTE